MNYFIRKIFVSLLLLLSAFYASGQQEKCQVCYANLSCTINPARPVVCPSSLPDGQVGNYYNEVVSFWMPAFYTDPVSGTDVNLLEFEIQSITELPSGFSFVADIYPNKVYFPNSSKQDAEYGCFRLSGTPDNVYNDSI